MDEYPLHFRGRQFSGPLKYVMVAAVLIGVTVLYVLVVRWLEDRSLAAQDAYYLGETEIWNDTPDAMFEDAVLDAKDVYDNDRPTVLDGPEEEVGQADKFGVFGE